MGDCPKNTACISSLHYCMYQWYQYHNTINDYRPMKSYVFEFPTKFKVDTTSSWHCFVLSWELLEYKVEKILSKFILEQNFNQSDSNTQRDKSMASVSIKSSNFSYFKSYSKHYSQKNYLYQKCLKTMNVWGKVIPAMAIQKDRS